MEGVYAFIIVLSLVALSVLAALVVKELKTLECAFKECRRRRNENEIGEFRAEQKSWVRVE